MSLIAVTGAIELGLIFALLALGIYVTFRVLGIPDLTVEGSFTVGAAVSAMLIANPIIAITIPFTQIQLEFSVNGLAWGLPLAVLAGAIAGFITAMLQTKLKIQPILAGILTMTAMHSINLFVMRGSPNIPLFRVATLFTPFTDAVGRAGGIILASIVLVIVGIFLAVFFHTRLGLSVRATGDNEEMVRASSINSTFTKTVGICIGNAIAALSGALIAQSQGFADLNMGVGMVVVALASLIIGEAIFGRRTVVWNICAVAAGAVIYRILIAFAISLRVNPANLRAISAAIVVVAISYPAIKEKWNVMRLRRRGSA